MRTKRPKPIIVRRAPGRGHEARIKIGHRVLRAAIGRGGLKAIKKEGDGGTPIGHLPIREGLYRKDRLKRSRVDIPMRPIKARDGWCDDPKDRNYNRPVKLPYGPSTESMKRADHLYDVVLVLGYNDTPRHRGRGSAIFSHLARPGYTPTEGCIAFSLPDMKAVLQELRRGGTFLVLP